MRNEPDSVPRWTAASLAPLVLGAAACGVSVPRSRPSPALRAAGDAGATQQAPTASASAAAQRPSGERLRELFRSSFSLSRVENVTEWTRSERDTLLVATTPDDRNTMPQTFWLRLDAAGSVRSQGEMGMSYPRALRLLDLTSDGVPELLLFGKTFNGANPYDPVTINAFTLAPDAGEPRELLRVGAALTSEFTPLLELLYATDPPSLLPGALPAEDAVQRVVARAERFVAPEEPASPGLFALGLQLASNDELRRSVDARGLQLCGPGQDSEHPRCQTLRARQLTDALLSARVRPLLGRLPAVRGEAPAPGVPLWSGFLTARNESYFFSESNQSIVVVEPTPPGNRLRRIVSSRAGL